MANRQRLFGAEIGWAVIGTSSHVRLRFAPALSRAPGTFLAAVCSREISHAVDLAARFGFARAYDSVSELANDPNTDVVYIATPNSLHAEMTVQAARAGKHVLVEKPMALNCADGVMMIETCIAHSVQLGVGYHLRHHPAQQEAYTYIRDGRIGNACLIDARWVSASPLRGGWWQDSSSASTYIMMTRGVHLVDLVCYLSGCGPEAVAMMDEISDRELEETATALLYFGNGMYATISASHASTAANGFSVVGTEGSIHALDTFGPDGVGTLVMTDSESRLHKHYESCDPYLLEIEQFNQAIRDGVPPNASGIDGLRVTRVTCALIQSARTGRTVMLNPD